jgi:hypothetical protein
VYIVSEFPFEVNDYKAAVEELPHNEQLFNSDLFITKEQL